MGIFDSFYVDLDGMGEVKKRVLNVASDINAMNFNYVSPGEYGVSNECYDTSSISNEKRLNVAGKITSFANSIDKCITLFNTAQSRAKALLDKYLNGEIDYFTFLNINDPNKPNIGLIGNSYYYYEGYPEMLKKFLKNDVDIDTTISSKLQLKDQEALLDAAARENKEEFDRIYNEFINRNLSEDQKYVSQYMNDHNPNGPGSLVYEQYRESAQRKHDAIVVEGMNMDNSENIEALDRIIEREKKKNPDVQIIIDDYSEMKQEDIDKYNSDPNIKVTNAKAVRDEVKNEFGNSTNIAERDGIPHPNKVSTYTNVEVSANYLSEALNIPKDEGYNGETTGAYYIDSTYGVIQFPRNNFNDKEPIPGSTDSGTDDKTDDYMFLTDEDIAKGDKIAKKY